LRRNSVAVAVAVTVPLGVASVAVAEIAYHPKKSETRSRTIETTNSVPRTIERPPGRDLLRVRLDSERLVNLGIGFDGLLDSVT
jgi:hypothetical protein